MATFGQRKRDSWANWFLIGFLIACILKQHDEGWGMRQLVVLVGLPGSGKTSIHEKKADWVVVSKDVIRHSVFRCSFDPTYEPSVDRIFSSALIETAESAAKTVCIDDLNLLRKERHAYIELAQMTHREPVVVIMPHHPLDGIYQRVQLQLEALAAEPTPMKVAPFSRDQFDALLRCYEAVQPNEGFARIERERALPTSCESSMPQGVVRTKRKRREEKRNPIPLFAA